MIPEDVRFEREGRPLRMWLLQLLAPIPLDRRLAENVVCAMRWGVSIADKTMHQHGPLDLKSAVCRVGKCRPRRHQQPGF